MNKYSEILCTAIDEIVTLRLQGINYDITIDCTIVDDSEKNIGKYKVSNGAMKFIAYSSFTEFDNDDVVLVIIPNGDYNNQKTIIGKLIDDTSKPFIYTSPFNTIVDFTNNILTNSTNAGLTANSLYDIIATDLIENYDNNEITQLISHWSAADKDEFLTDYTRIAISGEFMSWMEGLDTASGNYGLRVVCLTQKPILVEKADEEPEEEDLTQNYEFLLDSSDMYGNPYSFNTYFHQEKVFDISKLEGQIKDIKVYFYQSPGTFKDNKGQFINWIDDFGNPIGSNLFIKNPYVSFGYSLEDFNNEDKVLLYTLDNKTYAATAGAVENNYKTIKLRWIHKDNSGDIYSVSDGTMPLNCEIRWYKYKLGASSADNYSGLYWERIPSENIVQNFEYELLPDVTEAQEKIKVIIIYNNKILRSDILTFQNEMEVASKPTVDVVSALTILCEDNSFGNYYIYGKDLKILDSSADDVVRTMSALFDPLYYVDNAEREGNKLTEAEWIEWTIPVKNTMINISKIDIDLNQITYLDASGETTEVEEDICYWKIRREARADGSIESSQDYTIKSSYTLADSNNSVQCRISKDKTEFIAVKDFSFGTAGSFGMDVRLELDFTLRNAYLIANDTAQSIVANLRLLDYNGNNITDTLNATNHIRFKLITTTSKSTTLTLYVGTKVAVVTNELNFTQCEIKNISDNDLTITDVLDLFLLAEIDWGGRTLSTCIAIPTVSSVDMKNYRASVPKTIIYDTAGNITYLKSKLSILDDNNQGQVGVWSINTSKVLSEKERNYLVSVSEGYLRVPSLFIPDMPVPNLSFILSEDSDCWYNLPIIIMQNKYASNIIDDWSGKGTEINETEGSILANYIGAGSKNALGEFSGVMMGDWRETGSESSITTGLFGFHEGALSFGFKEDGTAFIGKSGTGRIIFDGTKGVIESSTYNSINHIGMSLDLNDGTLEAHLAGGYVSLDANASAAGLDVYGNSTSNYPLAIGSSSSRSTRTFRVSWDGSLYCTSGNIGSFLINDSGLYNSATSPSIILNARDGSGILGGFEFHGNLLYNTNKDILFSGGGSSTIVYDPVKKTWSFSNPKTGDIFSRNLLVWRDGDIQVSYGDTEVTNIEKWSIPDGFNRTVIGSIGEFLKVNSINTLGIMNFDPTTHLALKSAGEFQIHTYLGNDITLSTLHNGVDKNTKSLDVWYPDSGEIQCIANILDLRRIGKIQIGSKETSAETNLIVFRGKEMIADGVTTVTGFARFA